MAWILLDFPIMTNHMKPWEPTAVNRWKHLLCEIAALRSPRWGHLGWKVWAHILLLLGLGVWALGLYAATSRGPHDAMAPIQWRCLLHQSPVQQKRTSCMLFVLSGPLEHELPFAFVALEATEKTTSPHQSKHPVHQSCA